MLRTCAALTILLASLLLWYTCFKLPFSSRQLCAPLTARCGLAEQVYLFYSDIKNILLYSLYCGHNISLKSERKTHDLNHDLTFCAHTINFAYGENLFLEILGLQPRFFFSITRTFFFLQILVTKYHFNEKI